MKKVSEIAEKSKKPGLLLCGCWFLFLALGSESFYGLFLSTEKQLSNRLLVALITSASAALPSFFACGLFSKSLFMGKEPIDYYQKLIDRRSFWILAGFLSIASSIAVVVTHRSIFSLDQDELIFQVQVLCGILAGVYLIIGSSGFIPHHVSAPFYSPARNLSQPRITPTQTPSGSTGKLVNKVKASGELQCCVGNDSITAGQEVLECPFCKVKFHEQCARQRNIQQCPVCGKRLLLTAVEGREVPQGALLRKVKATTDLQCCVGNDSITAGQEVLECPFCKVKFHEQCARQRNIQQCPVCRKAIIF